MDGKSIKWTGTILVKNKKQQKTKKKKKEAKIGSPRLLSNLKINFYLELGYLITLENRCLKSIKHFS